MYGNVLVVGFKKSGVSAARLMRSLGRSVYVYDKAGIGNIPEYVKGDRSGYSYSRLFEGIDLVVLSPSVDINSELVREAKARSIGVIGEIEAASLCFRGEIVAVTGTNGKTTVTSLVESIFKAAGKKCKALGNIGTPFSDFFGQDIDIAALEVSSFQAESMVSFRPRAALFLNFAPDHLDRHKTMESYFAAKLNIFQNQRRGDYIIVNADDAYLFEYFTAGRGVEIGISGSTPEVIFFSAEKKVKGAYIEDGKILFNIEKDRRPDYVCDVSEVRLKGRHNLQNALAAVAAAGVFGIGGDAVSRALKVFEPPRARIEFVANIDGVSFFNDSKGTNIHATAAAVESMSESTALILGGSDKGEDFHDLFKVLNGKVKAVFVTGQNAGKILAAAADYPSVPVTEYSSLTECVREAFLSRCDNVLLSPASASFDRYKNYVERGEHFIKIVNGLKA